MEIFPHVGVISLYTSPPQIDYHSILDDMQKSEYSIIANFSRIFYEILVYYKNFSGQPGKEPEFVGRGQHATLPAIWGDMQISRITCSRRLRRREPRC